MTDGTHGSNAGTTQGSTQDGAQCYAIVHNMPGYLPVSDDRVVAIGEDAAARAMRDEVDRLLDYAVEGGQMSEDEASSDLASIDSAIADGDLQYRIRVDGGQSWSLPEINEVVNCIPVDMSELTADEIAYLDIDPVDLFTGWAERSGGMDSIDGLSAYAADSHVDDWSTGAYSRYSWHLLDPSHPGNDSNEWIVREIRERYVPCDYNGLQDADDPITDAHESGTCGCNETDSVDVREWPLVDVLDSTAWTL